MRLPTFSGWWNLFVLVSTFICSAILLSNLIYGGSPIKESNLIKSTEMSTYYIGFNTQSIPFDDINVRKAFAQSSNVETIVSNYFESVHQNAYGLIPPQMPDFNSNLDNNDYIYDPESALNYLSNSDYYLDKTLPDIFYNTPGYSGPNTLISEIINILLIKYLTIFMIMDG